MTPRERFLQTLTFGQPDQVPFNPGHGRKSTIARWIKEGLPEDRNPVDFLIEILGLDGEAMRPKAVQIDLDVNFNLMPIFEEKILEHKNGHYVVQDWKGNICEIDDQFDVSYLRQAIDFVTRRWIKCPVENRDDWEKIKQRYEIGQPGRFADDFDHRCSQAAGRDWPLVVHFSGPFWIMREWCGFEGLCMLMIDDPELVDEMAQFWCDFAGRILERIFEKVTPDAVHISEDMAYKAKSMISPDMCRRWCKPCWQDWAQKSFAVDVPLFGVDSDGFIEELVPLWIESGVNYCDPVEVAAHNDINAMRESHKTEMAFCGGVDKRCIAKGGNAIRDEIKRLRPVVESGGFIPGCDHGVPHDVSWPNFVEYSRLLAELTGWI